MSNMLQLSTLQGMQSELSPVCLSLSPLDRPVDEAIPFMGVDAENEWSTVATGSGPETGEATYFMWMLKCQIYYQEGCHD